MNCEKTLPVSPSEARICSSFAAETFWPPVSTATGSPGIIRTRKKTAAAKKKRCTGSARTRVNHQRCFLKTSSVLVPTLSL